MSHSGALWDKFDFFTLWEGVTNFRSPGGGDQNAKDRNEIWHVCYWPGAGQLIIGTDQLMSLHSRNSFSGTPILASDQAWCRAYHILGDVGPDLVLVFGCTFAYLLRICPYV